MRAATDKLVPVAGTQMGYGGLLNLDSHADLDFQDNHFYIDHYNSPTPPGTQPTGAFAILPPSASGLASYLNMAVSREAGRPYTVSEFNQPWPNRQAAEMRSDVLAAFGAFQDWDSIMHFAYSHGRHGTTPRLADSTSTATGPSARTSGSRRGCSVRARFVRESLRWKCPSPRKCGCSLLARGS